MSKSNLVRNLRSWRLLYIVAPFLLLLAFIAILNAPERIDLVEMMSPTADVLPTDIVVTPDNTSVLSTQLPPPAAASGPTSSPQSSPQPSPTPKAAGPISVLGPPDNSIFPSDGTVTFYWEWTAPLDEQLEFVVIASQGETRLSLGSVAGTEMYPAYHLEIPLGTDWAVNSDVTWKIALIDRSSQGIIAESPLRSIRLYVYNK